MSIDLIEQTTSHEKQRSLCSLKTDTIRACTACVWNPGGHKYVSKSKWLNNKNK